MKPKDLYEKQYGEGRLIRTISFPLFKKGFKKFDLSREELAMSMLNDLGGKFLDIGCGNGSLIFKVKEKFNEKFTDFYGVDISPTRIRLAEEEAKRKFGMANNIHFSVQNIDEGIDFPDEAFDVVTCLAVLEHVFYVYFVVKEIHRVLKNNGILILEVPNIAYLRYRIHLLFGKLPVTSSPYNWEEIGWDGGHLHYFTKSTLWRLLKDMGFEILKVSGSGLFAKFRNWWPSLLTGDICIKARKFEKKK